MVLDHGIAYEQVNTNVEVFFIYLRERVHHFVIHHSQKQLPIKYDFSPLSISTTATIERTF